MILVGLFQIICSFLATIPDPVLGGTLMVKTGIIIFFIASNKATTVMTQPLDG